MNGFLLWATLGLAACVFASDSGRPGGCPTCGCCSCCETGICRCATCTCECCGSDCCGL